MKGILSLIINLLTLAVLFHAIGSWFPSIRRSSFYQNVDKLIHPMLEPIRAVVKPINGIDFSPMVLLFLLYLIRYLLRL